MLNKIVSAESNPLIMMGGNLKKSPLDRGKATINYGIIGVGKHAWESHAIPAKDIPFLSLKALYDPNELRMQQLDEAMGRPTIHYRSESDLLAQPGLSMVLIANPDEYHLKSLELAVNAGKHVLIEKPLINNISEFDRLLQVMKVAREKSLTLTSCHIRRFDPPYIWFKKNLMNFQQHLGKLLIFNLDFSYHKPSAKWKKERSLMLDHLNHEIDALHFFLGFCNFRAKLMNDSHDYYQVSGTREDGVHFNFTGTRRLENHHFQENIFARFEKGTVLMDTKSGRTSIDIHERNKTHQNMLSDIMEAIGLARRMRSSAPWNGKSRLIKTPTTDYELRGAQVMNNLVNTILSSSGNYLTPLDLVINNLIGPQLLETGNFEFNLAHTEARMN